jgi:hypothetical protein
VLNLLAGAGRVLEFGATSQTARRTGAEPNADGVFDGQMANLLAGAKVLPGEHSDEGETGRVISGDMMPALRRRSCSRCCDTASFTSSLAEENRQCDEYLRSPIVPSIRPCYILTAPMGTDMTRSGRALALLTSRL